VSAARGDRPSPGIIESPGLWRAARLQARVVGALMIRDMHTRFGRRNIGYVWLFVEPMILAGAVGLMHLVAGKGVPGGLAIFPFYILGYAPYYLYRGVLNRAATAWEENSMLFYHRRVTLLDALIARTLLDLAAVLTATLVFLIGVGALSGEWPQDWVKLALGLVAMAALCHGGAMCILAFTVFGTANVERVVHPFTYLTLPISGGFFMLWWFPTDVQWWLSIYPTVHCFELVRGGFFGDQVPALYDVEYLVTCILVLNVAGMLALRAAAPHFERH
jgi:capsular polysaccharide transport system permease protein